ncbi:MAG TPA: beta-L-arabinofuranosidase domain-containing protein, partial [Chloroflexota bacterium]|nr:beta-L-arabinofuranosidase domain-containing protein [Chloroflexota bacterium]
MTAPVVDLRRSPQALLRPLPLTAFTLAPGFWHARLDVVRRVTLPSQYEQLERTGRIDHFRRASGRKQIPEFAGKYYDDSDVYKWVEAVAYALATQPDPRLAELVDAVIDEIAAAQEPDGYLNTYFTFEKAPQRWDNLARMHQLYLAGHLIQAAVAHHRATAKTTLLDVATRFADLICATFTPARSGTDGHEEIELALVELYRHTGQRRYLDQALFFLDQRGQTPPVLDGSEYLQDHLPVRDQREIVGHAVRATYLAIGMADTYAETGDPGLWSGVRALWDSAFERKAYVTGGLGARRQGEAFDDDHELPNDTAYAETCAAIGGFLWNWRMLHLDPDTTSRA